MRRESQGSSTASWEEGLHPARSLLSRHAAVHRAIRKCAGRRVWSRKGWMGKREAEWGFGGGKKTEAGADDEGSDRCVSANL